VSLEVRDLLGGRYRLEEPIGYGGMGRVYRAHDELLDRGVAVKLLDAAAVEAAGLDEARAAARLSHPGIVQIFDVGIQAETGYIVMELVPGQTLRQILRQRGSLASDEAAELAAQIADALEATHRHGLVHCDVKPLNILVTPSGHVKLVDFGIARATAASGTDSADEIRGSVAYVSPEQARGESVDGRSDVYSLGGVLYEMLVGRPPFGGGSSTTLTRRLVADPAPPGMLSSGISAELETIVMRALARDPARRYASAGEMRDALRAASSRPSTAPEAETTTQVFRAPLRTALSRRPRTAVTVAAIVGGIALIGGLATWRASHNSNGVPRLVGRHLSEVPLILEQAGIQPADALVLTRPVEPQYVGTVVDQQPQPGLSRETTVEIQIAVGVPQ
jgi:serine/threonine-protein kinase